MVDRAQPTTGPVRTCIGCRERTAPNRLVRFVVEVRADVRVVIADHGRNRPGRGAWLHPDRRCLRNALRRKAFGIALRTPDVVVDIADLERVIGGSADEPTDPAPTTR